MAPVSTICSLILALMVALSGGANVAEIPEVMDVLTLRNLALEVEMFDEEAGIEFPMEFVLSSAVGSHEGVLHFEMHDADGSVLLPVSGRVLSDALQFVIGDSENAYGIYEQTLRDEMMLTEQDEQLLGGLTDMVMYIVENEMMQNTDVQLSAMDVMCILADQKQLAAEETSVFYGDNEYPAQKRSYTVTREEIDALVKAPPSGLSDAEREAVEAYALMDGYYKLMEAAYNSILQDYPVNFSLNFSDSVDVEITEAEVDGEAYRAVKQSYSMDDTDYEIEYVTHGKRTRIGQRNVTEYEADGETVQNSMISEQVYDGSILAPEMISMVVMMQNHSEIDAYTTDNGMYISVTGGVSDGLWNIQGDASITEATNDGFNAESTMCLNYAEMPEVDGSKTGHFSLGMQVEGLLELGVSFDLNFAEAAYADFFEDREVIWLEEMTEEQANALEDEWTETLEAAGTAYEAWAEKIEEGMGLQTAQPEGIRANNSLRQSIREKVLDEEMLVALEEYEEEYEVEYEEEYEEYVIPEYYSWAEVQADFSAEIPNYTAPEKWPLTKIEMFHEDYMYASFGDDYDGFAIDISDYGNTGVERYAVQDGELVPFEGVVIESYSEDGNIYWATFNYGSCVVGIYFNGEANLADLEAVLAGFEF